MIGMWICIAALFVSCFNNAFHTRKLNIGDYIFLGAGIVASATGVMQEIFKGQ